MKQNINSSVMKGTDMQTFMVNINKSGWIDVESEGIQDLQKELTDHLSEFYNDVEVITEDLNLLTFVVIGMNGRFSWKRKDTL